MSKKIEYLTIQQAAAYLGITRQAIDARIEKGLKTFGYSRCGRVIAMSDLLAYKPGKPGPIPGKKKLK